MFSFITLLETCTPKIWPDLDQCTDKTLILYIRLLLQKSCFQEPIIIRIQAFWRGCLQRRLFSQLFQSPAPPFAIVCKFAPRVNVAAEIYKQEMQLHQVNAQVVQKIHHNRQLAQQIDSMDIKIGLLVQNRIAVHEVLAHRKGLNELSSTTNISQSTSTLPGLKSVPRLIF